MEYMVIYKDADGNTVSTKPLREKAKNAFISTLDCEYAIKECADTLYNCPKVIFDLQKLEEARKAVKEGKDLPGVIYTCGDINKIAKRKDIVKVQCTNGTRTGIVVDIWKATFDEIVEYKAKIHYAHLSMVVEKV